MRLENSSPIAPAGPVHVEGVLRRMTVGDEDPLRLITDLVAALRPAQGQDEGAAAESWRRMIRLLAGSQDYRDAVRVTLLMLFAGREQRRLYTEAGLLPNTGFFAELNRRLTNKILPELKDDHDLKDCYILSLPINVMPTGCSLCRWMTG